MSTNNSKDNNFIKSFLNYIKDKPFYLISKLDGKPAKTRPILRGDGVSGLYYVGDQLGGNAIFEPETRVIVYFFSKTSRDNDYSREDTYYWNETVIDNFESGTWVLAEWYEHGLSYEDVVKNLTTIKDFNPFDGLNESEEDDFSWVVDTISEPVKLMSLWRNDSLKVGDVIALYGDVRDSERSLFILKGEKFKVHTIRHTSSGTLDTINFNWLTPDDKRPSRWDIASSGGLFTIDNSTMVPPSGNDGELIVEFVNEDLTESEELDWVNDLGGEMFGDEVKYNYIRTGDEIIFTTDQSFRGCGFSEEFEKGKVLKTNGTKLLVLTDNITFCGPNLHNWSNGSRTMLEGLVEKCKGNKEGHLEIRYHNCVEIDRNTRAKYYMVKKREELNESKQSEHPIEVGTSIYCHKSINSYEEGKWYKVSEVDYGHGNHNEDIFRIYNHEDGQEHGTWTIQKDENGLNYEKWFSLGDPSFDTNKAFETLYEDSEKGINLEDGTTIVFPYDYKDEDVYKLLHWLTQNGWVKGYGDKDLKQMLFDLDRPWHKGNRRPFFMLRKGGTYGEPTVYWSPTGDLTASPKTFSKVIKAEDLLSSIDTDFFITESTDDDFEWTKDVLKPLYNCSETVIVTDRGQVYTAYLNAMAELDVPFALDITNKIRTKYGVEDVSDNEDYNWRNGMAEDHSKGVNELNSKNVLDSPENGDVCCLYGKRWRHLSRLIRLSDGKNFIMNDRGFKPYTPPNDERLVGDHWTKLDESEEWFEDVEDYSKYIKVGQKFSFASWGNKGGEKNNFAQISQVLPHHVKIVPVNVFTKKPNPYVSGTRFTYKRLLELLNSGDWVPVNDVIKESTETNRSQFPYNSIIIFDGATKDETMTVIDYLRELGIKMNSDMLELMLEVIEDEHFAYTVTLPRGSIYWGSKEQYDKMMENSPTITLSWNFVTFQEVIDSINGDFFELNEFND